MWILFNLVSTSTVCASLLYWIGRLVNKVGPSVSLFVMTVHVHLSCSILVFIELLVTKIPVRVLHFYPVTAYCLLYICFTYIFYQSGGSAEIYEILSWKNDPKLALIASLLGCFVFVPLVHFFFTYLIFRFRIYLGNFLEKRLKHSLKAKTLIYKGYQKNQTVYTITS